MISFVAQQAAYMTVLGLTPVCKARAQSCAIALRMDNTELEALSKERGNARHDCGRRTAGSCKVREASSKTASECRVDDAEHSGRHVRFHWHDVHSTRTVRKVFWAVYNLETTSAV